MDVLVYLAGRAGELVGRARAPGCGLADRVRLLQHDRRAHLRAPRSPRGRRAETPLHRDNPQARLPADRGRSASDAGAEPEPGVLAELRPERADERPPYPGLAPFTEADAEDFFGREAEIAALWRKIASRRLLAVIGASGAGKSSLLRAGVVARAPPGWRAVVCQPGEEPFLARGEGAGARPHGRRRRRCSGCWRSTTRTWRWRWWRAGGGGGTRRCWWSTSSRSSSPSTRSRCGSASRSCCGGWSTLPGSTWCWCCATTSCSTATATRELEPIFSDLTPIGPPAGTELRRALTEPAARRLYGFESESIVDEMVGEVEAERGALPLLAFAVSRLWELRDRERRLLTREAYERIGGVGGALAQHAEATLEGIGPRAAADGAGAFPQPGDGAGDAGGARAWTSCSRSSRIAARGGGGGAARAGRRAAADLVRGRGGRGGRGGDAPPGRDRARVAAARRGRGSCAGRPRTPTARMLRDQLRQAARPVGGEGASRTTCCGPGPRTRSTRCGGRATRAGCPSSRRRSPRRWPCCADRRRRRRRIAAVAASLAVLLAVLAVVGGACGAAACTRPAAPRRASCSPWPRLRLDDGSDRGAGLDHREPGDRRHPGGARVRDAGPPDRTAGARARHGRGSSSRPELQPGRPPRRRGRLRARGRGCGPRTGRDRRCSAGTRPDHSE